MDLTNLKTHHLQAIELFIHLVALCELTCFLFEHDCGLVTGRIRVAFSYFRIVGGFGLDLGCVDLLEFLMIVRSKCFLHFLYIVTRFMHDLFVLVEFTRNLFWFRSDA